MYPGISFLFFVPLSERLISFPFSSTYDVIFSFTPGVGLFGSTSYTYVTFCGSSVTFSLSVPSVRAGTRLYTFPLGVVILAGFNASVAVLKSFPVGASFSASFGVSYPSILLPSVSL